MVLTSQDLYFCKIRAYHSVRRWALVPDTAELTSDSAI